MRIARALVVSAAVGLQTGCSALAPYPTFPRAAALGENATALRVAICYNTLVSTVDEVQVAAQQECPSDTTATPFDTDWYLQYCPLLLPARATFFCAAKK
jgi:hypothetical protein